MKIANCKLLMKKVKSKIIIGLLLIILFTFFTTDKVFAADYTIADYDINMVVNEDNTFNITETITAYFYMPKHGIYRKIPLRNTVKREDGTSSKNKAIVSEINVSDNYTTKIENGYRVLQIGDSDTTVTGNHTYIISYKYDIGKDPLKDVDELYYNLIGDEWDTAINNVSFTIKMPKDFEQSKLGFSSGVYGTVGTDDINYTVEGTTITGTLNKPLYSGEALTVRLTLPEGYFNVPVKIDYFMIITIAIFIVFIIIAYILWRKYGKEDAVIETVEFYPPEGYNSAEIGFLYKGRAENKDVVSLLIYLANKGYLKIAERETKTLFSKSKGFTITKLKDYDGDNESERLFLEGLFKKKDVVTDSDLYDSFYITVNKIIKNLNKKENKNKIFEPMAGKMGKWIILMIIVIIGLIMSKIVYSDGSSVVYMPMLFVLIAILVLATVARSQNSIAARIFLIIWSIMFGGIPFIIGILPSLLYDLGSLITFAIGIVTIAILIVFMNIMPKRSKYGNEILGRIRGFRRFLQTAEKEKLESLVHENPEYFYNILPYTYALGVSEEWMNQFETIAMQAPEWYECNGVFLIHDFNHFMTSAMLTAQTSMTSAPSSSSSGGGFSGGGFSGGGSGGGRWRFMVIIIA